MENDILDSLDDIGYTGPILEEGGFVKALQGGPKSIEYTILVEWLCKELKILCKLDESVNAIKSEEESSNFLLEISSFLKELGCSYTGLVEGHVSERLSTKHNRMLLLEYLLSELMAAKMVRVERPELNKGLELKLNESSTAADLKTMLIVLKFPKPPENITPAVLFTKVENKVKEVLNQAPAQLVGKPLFTGKLSEKQWQVLGERRAELQQEYRVRRDMLLKRLDVTIQSFQAKDLDLPSDKFTRKEIKNAIRKLKASNALGYDLITWSDVAKKNANEVAAKFKTHRSKMQIDPAVNLADLLAARDDLAILEKTSSASVRKNTQSSINKVMIGRVPDRGGRPSEQAAPPPEMPSWQKDRAQGGGGRGGGDFSRGRGRGGRVQGGWNQGGGYQDTRGGHQDNRAYQDTRGGHEDMRSSHQDNRGYQDNRGGYDDRGGGHKGGHRGQGGRDRRENRREYR